MTDISQEDFAKEMVIVSNSYNFEKHCLPHMTLNEMRKHVKQMPSSEEIIMLENIKQNSEQLIKKINAKLHWW